MTVPRLFLGLLFLCPGPALAQIPDPQAVPPPTEAQSDDGSRFQEFLSDSVRLPLFFVKAFGSTVLDQISKMPEEWTGGKGFMRRTTSRVGLAFAGETISHSVAAVLHHRLKYDACASCDGSWQRTTHALSRAFVSVHEDRRLVPNYSLLAAKYAPATLANAWYPASYTASGTIWGASRRWRTSSRHGRAKRLRPREHWKLTRRSPSRARLLKDDRQH